MILGVQTVTRLRASTSEDAYGNETSDWPGAARTVINGCSVQPVEGSEVTVGRETVVSRWRIWAPEGTDLVANDRVEYAGDAYDVDGEVQRWDFPPLSYVSALLRRGADL